jgi:Chaperone of endosialidase
MNPLTQSKNTTIRPVLIVLVLGCFAFLPKAQAVVPAPDGGYPSGNTAEGTNALFSLTTGQNNTANGSDALFSNTTGNSNTATGVQALLFNTQGSNNTANGSYALPYNTTGDYNTAIGYTALYRNTTGTANTANGANALRSNTTGNGNTANGGAALHNNTTGNGNTANGDGALFSNTTGNYNTANGGAALYNNTSGSLNVALGLQAGMNLTTGSGNVCIGAGVFGVAGESNTTRIRNVYASVATARAVYINSNNKIGTLSSSRRYKEEIKPMDKASETIFALRPVSFRYKKEVDAARALSFGLIAEEVAETSPELITRDEGGNPQTVRYEAVNAMLLNEFLKEHKTVQEQRAAITQQRKDFEAAIAQQQKQIEMLTAALQKVSAQLEVSKSAPEVVENNQ